MFNSEAFHRQDSSTRAGHLELGGDLSTDFFILTLQPKPIWSDNGTNFVGANSELKNILKNLDHNKSNNTFVNHKIFRKFNPPSSPWMGGFWECIVKVTKRCLTFIIKDKPISEQALVTFLTEVEATWNIRQLTQL